MKEPTPAAIRAGELLAEAMPGAAVSVFRGRKGYWLARRTLSTDLVKYAHLVPFAHGHLALRFHPADTLTQARAFYGRPAVVQRVLDLRGNGWRIEPNFHFGYIARGLTWTTSALDADAYSEHWVRRIDDIGVVRRPEWSAFLDELVELGIFDRENLRTFEKDFRSTKRMEASPRPGLLVEKIWTQEHADDPDLPKEIAAAAGEFVQAIGVTG